MAKKATTKPAEKSVKKSDVKSTFDFQKKFTALEQITDDFESGKYDLETGLKKFEEGLAIAQELKAHLEQVENKIEIIKGKYDEFTQEDE